MSASSRSITGIILAALAVLASSGCATSQLGYYWGNYDDTLHGLYKGTVSQTEYAEALNNIVAAGETEGKVPPGVYAEAGYAFYEIGQMDQAVYFFEKERAMWPESQDLMDKMIRNAKVQE